MTKNEIACIPWGRHQSKDVYLFKIKNESGAYAEFSNYGAHIISVVVPDRNGLLESVVLGFETLDAYLKDTCYLGATIGRFANRISKASFILDDQTHHLEKNDGDNSNHGGSRGFHSQVFDFIMEDDKLIFSLFSADGEGGYPGNLQFKVSYRFTDDNQLMIDYFATSDEPTVLNFTSHAYFNLSAQRENILEHKLTVKSSMMLETTRDFIPTGIIKKTEEKTLEQSTIKDILGGHAGKLVGLNDYYIGQHDYGFPIAILEDEFSGRALEVYTSYPGLQVYTGDYLYSNCTGNQNKKYKPFDGLCLECHYYPDSPNHENFPLKIFSVGNDYHENIVFKFTNDG